MDLKSQFNQILKSIKKANVAATTVSAGDESHAGAVIGFSDPTATMIAKSPGVLPEFPKKKIEIPEEENLVNIDIDTLLASTQKILAISNGLTTPDERDSLRFRRLHPVNDLMRERIKLDADKVMQNALRKIARRKNLSALSIGFADPYTEKLLVGHALSAPLEEINPMHLVEQSRRITQMGPGGLPSDRSITQEAQSLHPHEFGFLSAVEGPESSRIGVDTRAAWGTKIGSDGKLYQRFYSRKDKKYVWLSPTDLENKIIGFPE